MSHPVMPRHFIDSFTSRTVISFPFMSRHGMYHQVTSHSVTSCRLISGPFTFRPVTCRLLISGLYTSRVNTPRPVTSPVTYLLVRSRPVTHCSVKSRMSSLVLSPVVLLHLILLRPVLSCHVSSFYV